jgi:putative transposase
MLTMLNSETQKFRFRRMGWVVLAAAVLLGLCANRRAPMPLSDLMGKLKANSSKWVHQQWPERRRFGWQEGYAAFSVSQSNLSRVKDYIASQEKHHVRMSFREELKAFLNRNDIAYDPRYVGA